MPFTSFFMGGFECSTHRDARGRRLDLIASTRHDEFALTDYSRLVERNMLTCRDGLRWHLIEPEPFRYDFSSLKQQIDAAKATGIEVVWDYFHYGYPDDLDIFSPAFVERFASFCKVSTEYLTNELGESIFVCPVNEISFFSWIAGHVGQFYPCSKRRGGVLKRQLVRAALAGVKAIRSVNPDAKIVVTDPAIHVVSRSKSAAQRRAAENYRLSQFEAFDMLSGRKEPELGGNSKAIDVIGLNYYFHNQWHFPSRRKIPIGHEVYRPLADILREFYFRYHKPLLIAETGIEDDERPGWFRYVCSQTRLARSNGVDVNGVCLYPIVNHPGWADDRHCHNGLWDYADESGAREIYEPLASEIEYQLSVLTQTASA
jgi:beta-glucosidase/6-phospho-beta-glucosidase/beta-galactosidase